MILEKKQIMKYTYIIAIVALLGTVVGPAKVMAQSQLPTISVSGEVTKPLSLKMSDLDTMRQAQVVHKEKDGKDHTYTGVLLSAILQNAGATMGKDLKGKNLAKYILVEAADGYKVVFALAELDKEFTDRLIILADKVDGKPISAGTGPFQVIVQDEKKAARCVKQVTGIKVALAK
jgi:DMSO/TMAO reductase YedYZ molybdopterin-dependent catalytic subunit